jgi:hypothetical protein
MDGRAGTVQVEFFLPALFLAVEMLNSTLTWRGPCLALSVVGTAATTQQCQEVGRCR